MLNNESLCESQMVPLRNNLWEPLYWSKKKKGKKKLKIREIIFLKESSFIFWFSGASSEIFNFDFFFFLSCFLLVLLPFDYDDYDPKRFKISYKRETSIREGEKNKCNKIVINISIAWIHFCLIRRRLKIVEIAKILEKH